MASEHFIGLSFAAYYSYDNNVTAGILAYHAPHMLPVAYIRPTDSALALQRMVRIQRPAVLRGIIAEVWNESQLRVLQRTRIPAVDVSGTWDPSQIPSVHVDNQAVGKMVAEHFLSKGLRHLAFVGHPLALHSRQRRDGFAAEAGRVGASCFVFERPSANSPSTAQEYSTSLEQWLGRLPKPVGLMSWNDFRAPLIQEACARAGVAIPDELAMIGVDNDSVSCTSCRRPLSSVDTNGRQVGYQAMALVHRLIRGESVLKEHMLVPPAGIVIRGSSDIQAVGDPMLAKAFRFIQDNIDKPINVESILRAVRSVEGSWKFSSRLRVGPPLTSILFIFECNEPSNSWRRRT